MSDIEIREKISDYLAERVSLVELEDWISTEIWDSPQSEARQLGYDALRLVSEAQNGEWTDDELRIRLASLLGILKDGAGSVPADTSPKGEGFLDKLSAAQNAVPLIPVKEEGQGAALLSYATLGIRLNWSEMAQPNAPAFLRQPGGERNTPGQAPKEAVAG